MIFVASVMIIAFRDSVFQDSNIHRVALSRIFKDRVDSDFVQNLKEKIIQMCYFWK